VSEFDPGPAYNGPNPMLPPGILSHEHAAFVESAITKLAAIGLTDNEARAIMGLPPIEGPSE
jgi:hypothetical protein